ncbi:MAG TPA: STAS domain-containing protein [Acidimicrobiia bacterium]|nr:STAS domain-containing protein [Acidimicrobiia bacterium]
MIGHEFEVTTRPDGDGRVTFELSGDINAAAGDRLGALHSELDRDGLNTLVLDFERVEYINSTGIALIVALLARARTADVDVVAFGLSDHYREIFQITRLADFMGIFPDRASALRAAQG